MNQIQAYILKDWWSKIFLYFLNREPKMGEKIWKGAKPDKFGINFRTRFIYTAEQGLRLDATHAPCWQKNSVLFLRDTSCWHLEGLEVPAWIFPLLDMNAIKIYAEAFHLQFIHHPGRKRRLPRIFKWENFRDSNERLGAHWTTNYNDSILIHFPK